MYTLYNICNTHDVEPNRLLGDTVLFVPKKLRPISQNQPNESWNINLGLIVNTESEGCEHTAEWGKKI